MFQRGRQKALFLISIAALILHAPTQAQQSGAQVQPAPVESAKQDSPDSSKLSNQVDQLRTKVEQLESLVGEQQQVLAELKKRLAESEAKAQATAITVSSLKADGSTGAPPKIVNGSTDANQSLAKASPATQAAPSAQAKEQSKPAPLAGWDDNHAYLRSADGSFVTYLTGYGQLDFHGYQSGNHPPNTFLIRRARLALEGKIARYYDFKVEGDFADTAGTLLRDLYVRIHRNEEVQLTAGQFKEPFSQEELRADAYQDFVERSLVNNLAPSRSPGVMGSGVLRKGTFEYQLGAFNGKGLQANNNSGTPESVVRLRFAPWKNTKAFWVNGLAFGGAYAQGRNAAGQSVRGLTESRSFTFFTPDTVNGAITRANGELTWLLGPAAFRAEYDQTNQARNGLGPKGTVLPGVVAKGYVGQFTYLLTGEKKPDSGAVAPKHNLFGDAKNPTGFGAWELKMRYANLQISDGTAKSNRADTIYFGANWYLNRFVRYMLDFGLERFKDPLRAPRPGEHDFFVVLSRIQVAF
jgi:phosphate-selective porin OprO/OprP